jgi:hypothetical protein
MCSAEEKVFGFFKGHPIGKYTSELVLDNLFGFTTQIVVIENAINRLAAEGKLVKTNWLRRDREGVPQDCWQLGPNS